MINQLGKIVCIVVLTTASSSSHFQWRWGKHLPERDHKNDSTLQYRIDTAAQKLTMLAKKDNELLTLIELFYADTIRLLNKTKELDKAVARNAINYNAMITKLSSGPLKSERQTDSIIRNAHAILTKEDSLKTELQTAKDAKQKLSIARENMDMQQKQRKAIDEEMLRTASNISEALNSLPGGAYAYCFFARPYRFFIADTLHEIVMVYNNTKTGASLENISEHGSRRAEMVTNAGMFEPDFSSVGLFIEKGKELKKIDTVTNKPGNFYLSPNGIFYIDTMGSSNIVSTQEFTRKMRAPGTGYLKNIKYATQSGPLLLGQNGINPNFRFGSTNMNIRSAVGLLKNGKTLFVKTDEPVNFMELAMVLRYFFNSGAALFLDGAISKMVVSNLYGQATTNDHGGAFGPLIAVYKKNKPK